MDLARKPQKSYEWIRDDLKRKIEEGELEPGQRLPSVVELAARYGVGRSSIREALSALKAMGWLSIRQGGGTFVEQELPRSGEGAGGGTGREGLSAFFADADSLREMMEVRKVLESGCASLAALHRTEEDAAELDAIVRSMAASAGDEKQEKQLDIRFHLQIARASRNTLLLQMMESLTERFEQTIKETRQLWFYGERATADRLLEEHASIAAAIRAGDGQQAALLMQRHLGKVEQVLSRLF
ncbi:HTH-type transcriptional regulator LutR [Paenibacillus sp. J31TS4]|uniref:FadR/GntR family transcriptional regulator n=1 Tax=Paenibacillus sp. J31TS4 TaxID=2807195 RepID=UPI001AFE09D0|nr:FadR/GntR family transcriptional regulator [Paenibacillus sp. J31TS4]GIP37517.1 HTH-type transcriptional regulator LutR [Paenibacillus sp. J31TS4]